MTQKQKEKRKYLRDVKVIPGELQHRLEVVDVEEQKLRRSVKKSEMEGEEAEGKRSKESWRKSSRINGH